MMGEGSNLDGLINTFDRALRILASPARSRRPFPGDVLDEAKLSAEERRQAGALMRVNHAGEICAQALYQGQSLTARDPVIRDALRKAAEEEAEHLAWTRRRIDQLGARSSLLNPFWYAGSLALGALAGRMGDRWNLGFLEETENQVEAHLGRHLGLLPAADAKSRAVIEQMQVDEAEHARTARQLGAQELPSPVRLLMRLASRLMTETARRL